ncbi:MAG TPA: N-acetyl sugar amidotransferase [Candidatus Limiplasma sp.]|nr:N-acetyl sugar amidotransferase [Candidatus Limiplasma sp.]
MPEVCSRCVMDTSDPAITFDAEGVCSCCHRYDEQKALRGYRPGKSEEELQALVQTMKDAGKGKEFDCIVGISGGVDSAYLAYTAKKLGLRMLAVHVDTGWNSEIAVRNIERLCNALGLELHTIVQDWPTMKELQRAYLLSGLSNLDVPQDHLLVAAVYQFSKQYGVRYVLNGTNIATEGASSPFSTQLSCMDSWHLRSVYHKCGRGKSLKKYQMLSLVQARWKFSAIEQVNLLNHIPYSKKEAIATLECEYGWEYYGGKHFESRFTKWFQSAYLPRKFGYDKRRYHLSCLINNGEMTRDEALSELARPPYDPEQMREDEAYILKKLDITQAEWNKVMAQPPTPNDAYFSQEKLIRFAEKLLGKKRTAAIKQQKSV